MSPSPIHKALSIFRAHRVRAMLMGGQACILYGAAEFSRDIDFDVLADENNLSRLRAALHELQAKPVFVPPLSTAVLLRGHACHFRSAKAETRGLRIDVMSVLHGCEPFDALWSRRRTLSLAGVGRVHVLALEDLVQAKKTQRDKDWPMVRRLLESDFHRHRTRPSRERVGFWLREVRTSDLLIELCRRFPGTARRLLSGRAALQAAVHGDVARVEQALQVEQDWYRASDRQYWAPLRTELARWRLEQGR
ncbi:MAG: hypothetical protein ACRD2N_14490 [Vicinamibacterales bacterium]